MLEFRKIRHIEQCAGVCQSNAPAAGNQFRRKEYSDPEKMTFL